MKLRELKVKIKSLAEEQRIIKHEERKALKQDKWQWRRNKGSNAISMDYAPNYESLRNHRVRDVRPEIRASLLAYGILRGKNPYDIDSCERSEPDWRRVKAILTKFKGTTPLSELNLPAKLK